MGKFVNFIQRKERQNFSHDCIYGPPDENINGRRGLAEGKGVT